MPSAYLQSADYANYGVPNATVAQVSSASVLIDAYLKRPEGLIWSPDSGGNPAWMAALTPALTLNAAAGFAPGTNVTVPITGLIAGLNVGEVLIADRTNGAKSEALVVGSITGNSVIFQSVVNSHLTGCALDLGMTLKQHKFMPDGRPMTTMAYTPIVRLLSGQGRYGYGRRGDAARYMVDEFNLLASLSHFGGPPVWEAFPLTNTGVDPQTGQLWVPAGVMLAYYSEVNIWYVAGYSYANLPDQIKFACAQLITAKLNALQAGNVKSYKAGDTQIQMFAASLLDDDAKAQLAPFRAKLFS